MARRERLLLALLICAAGMLGTAASASGYLRDFEQVRTGTPTSSATYGGRSLSCPSGKFLIGVGGGVPSGPSWTTDLALTGLWIRSASQGASEVSGVETDPVSLPWQMAAAVYCAAFTFTPPSAAPGASYIKAVNTVSNESPLDSSTLKSVTAGCLGRESIGGGFSIEGPGVRHVTARGAHLFDGDNADGYLVTAMESDVSSAAWRLRSYAICADRSASSPPGGQYVGNSLTTLEATRIASPFTSSVSVTAPCPAGTRAIGGGAEVRGASNTAVAPSQVVLTRSHPVAPAGTAGHGWIATAVEEDLTFARWRVRARAVCAPFVPHS